MSDPIIQINNMNKWFGDFQVLKDINLDVEKNKIEANTYPSIAKPSHSGFVFAKFNIPTISNKPTTNIKGVSFTNAKKVLAIPGITNFKA